MIRTILCTGGMSVDPDDNTPDGIRQSGESIVTYGATVFDLGLPRIAAGVEVTKADLVQLGEGGLCPGCKPCH